MKTITLAHYYTIPEVQQMADFVGDSLQLAQEAQKTNADRIVFVGVKFMAETAKMLNPNAEVILPDEKSTCSLVTMTDMNELEDWVFKWSVQSDKRSVHICYINSSAEHKALADVTVTSSNVEEICQYYAEKGYRILFSPDRNMGAYLKHQHPDWDIRIWKAVCEVHDQFKEDQISMAMVGSPNAYLIAHPESPLPVLKRAHYVGSTKGMLEFVKNVEHRAVVFVATEEGLLHNMRELRSDVDIIQAPMYDGCKCFDCKYMKKNTAELVKKAQEGQGFIIDYLSDDLINRAKKPIEKMMEFNK